MHYAFMWVSVGFLDSGIQHAQKITTAKHTFA